MQNDLSGSPDRRNNLSIGRFRIFGGGVAESGVLFPGVATGYLMGMDLFADQHQQARARVAPLAVRMRPRTLDEFVGQEHFIGQGKLLRRMLQADRLSSAIFYGPPGTGKTTLAHIIAETTQAAFEKINAAGVGVKEVREIIERAKARVETDGQRTIIFIDELHRFNKAQQDVLLNDVESGVIILIGATTENPFFSVNSPLVSRSQIFQFEPLTADHIAALMRRALADEHRGLGRCHASLTTEAIEHLAISSNGDARRALTALEIAVLSQASSDSTEAITIDLETAQDSIQRKAIRYDKLGDEHYDAASALIKSMRGSDPDAAVYWLARMLEAGEDPRFVARRIAICASEDIGNADPMALVLAGAAFQVTLQIGMPECQLVLAQVVTYLACAPKSNAAALAIWQAARDVRDGETVPVPKHLRSGGAANLAGGMAYQSPHDSAEGFVKQEYLGVDKKYYKPTARGHEAVFREYLARLEQGQDEQ